MKILSTVPLQEAMGIFMSKDSDVMHRNFVKKTTMILHFLFRELLVGYCLVASEVFHVGVPVAEHIKTCNSAMNKQIIKVRNRCYFQNSERQSICLQLFLL